MKYDLEEFAVFAVGIIGTIILTALAFAIMKGWI